MIKKSIIIIFILLLLTSLQTEPPGSKQFTVLDVAYGNDPEQVMDIYLPAYSEKPANVVVLIHGGGWHFGDKSGMTNTAKSYQKIGLAVFNINYRLGRDPDFFTMDDKLDDIELALAWIYSHKTEWNLSDHLTLLGSSAGGHLSLLYGFTRGYGRVNSIMSYAGPTNLTNPFYEKALEMKGLIGSLFPETPKSEWKTLLESYSPLFVIPENPPAVLMVHGTMDKTVDFNDSKDLFIALQKRGSAVKLIPVKGVGHNFAGTNWNEVSKKMGSWFDTWVLGF